MTTQISQLPSTLTCTSCNQSGHKWYDCQCETFCEVCQGCVEHPTKVHYECERCKKFGRECNVFARHQPCPKVGCNGCAAEQYAPMIWFESFNRVKCTTCGSKWSNLDDVGYERLDQSEINK